jgi:hypothetical protein
MPQTDSKWLLRVMDQKLVNVLTAGKVHPHMVQLLPGVSNVGQFFMPVQENCREADLLLLITGGFLFMGMLAAGHYWVRR